MNMNNMETMTNGGIKKTGKLVSETVGAVVAILVFYFCQGAVVMTQGLDGLDAKLTQAIFIWASVIAAVLFFLIKHKSLAPAGFRKIDREGLRAVLYCVPMILIALSGMIHGIDVSDGKFILANLLLTVAVGFSEEIYFRGIVMQNWLINRGKVKAVVISSVIFGVVHLMNVMGGADLFGTILQIFFALFYGVVMALVFIRTNSIWPCVVLHFLHDFLSFIGIDGTMRENIILASIQTVVLLSYMVYLIIKERGREPEIQGADE